VPRTRGPGKVSGGSSGRRRTSAWMRRRTTSTRWQRARPAWQTAKCCRSCCTVRSRKILGDCDYQAIEATQSRSKMSLRRPRIRHLRRASLARPKQPTMDIHRMFTPGTNLQSSNRKRGDGFTLQSQHWPLDQMPTQVPKYEADYHRDRERDPR